MAVTDRAFDPQRDLDTVWQLACQAYQPLHMNGMPAPFFEYAAFSLWMDASRLNRCRLWLDDGHAVAFAYYENPPTDAYFTLLPGYGHLADDMLDHAERVLAAEELVLFPAQTALLDAAQARGYRLAWTQTDHVLDLRTTALAHPLPAGYRVVEDVDPVKLAQCVWYGFDHGDKGAFAGWEQDTPGDWTPRKAYLNVQKVNRAPHATPHLSVTIADDAGEYVCHAGMWWVPENGLAYLEPLCTVPAHRRRGLAAAALSILQARMQALGATHLTGGGDPFYRRLGFAEQARWLHLRK